VWVYIYIHIHVFKTTNAMYYHCSLGLPGSSQDPACAEHRRGEERRGWRKGGRDQASAASASARHSGIRHSPHFIFIFTFLSCFFFNRKWNTVWYCLKRHSPIAVGIWIVAAMWHVKIESCCSRCPQELPLPRNVEWPKGVKARRVAEAVYADMRKPLGWTVDSTEACIFI
jgi:hypothetical protein